MLVEFSESEITLSVEVIANGWNFVADLEPSKLSEILSRHWY